MTDIERVEEIQESLKRATDKKSRAEGALETLNTRMREEFKCGSLDDLKAKRDKFKTKAEKLEKRSDRLLEELEAVTDWDAV